MASGARPAVGIWRRGGDLVTRQGRESEEKERESLLPLSSFLFFSSNF